MPLPLLAVLLLLAPVLPSQQVEPGRVRGSASRADPRVYLRLGSFDPLTSSPVLPPLLGAPPGGRLFYVQAHGPLDGAVRASLAAEGLEIVGYWPANVYVVRGERENAEALRAEPWVRFCGPVPLAFRIAPELHPLILASAATGGAPVEYNLVLARKSDRERLIAGLVRLGVDVTRRYPGSLRVCARLRPDQLLAAAALDSVLWIDAVTPLDVDMDNARIQGGANHVEQLGGLSGTGVRIEITEGLDPTHPDWTNPPLLRFFGVEAHGHATAMIACGNGSGNPMARGLLPDGQAIEASFRRWGTRSRYQVMRDSVDPSLPWRVMLQTASWGSARTTSYTSMSAALDDALLDHDMLLTQSHGALGATGSRPEAWAKNALSVGGVMHFDNADPLDDSTGTGALGPAADGRIKPELVAYVDDVFTGDLVGAAGFASGNYFNFGGISAATPIVAGYAGLAQEMFTDGLFGNPLPLPATSANRFANRPHAMTTKALLCNTAASYAFTPASAVNRREQQGWGFPDVARLFDERDRILVVDEYDVLLQGQSVDRLVWVRPGTAELRATMAYADPPGSPAAQLARVNDLDLSVRRFGTGTVWFGNNGLDAGNVSTSGGSPNDRDTLEQVWIRNPASDVYTISVRATSVVQDARPSTPAVDVDHALVVHPLGGGYRTTGPVQFDLRSTRPGELVATVTGAPATGWTDGHTLLSLSTAGPRAFGRFFGIEADFLTTAIFFAPVSVGDVFHFAPGGANDYPAAPFTFAPGLVMPFSGLTVDGFVVLWNGGQVVEMSDIDRVTLQ